MEEGEKKEKPTYKELCEAVERRFDGEFDSDGKEVKEHYNIRTSKVIGEEKILLQDVFLLSKASI